MKCRTQSQNYAALFDKFKNQNSGSITQIKSVFTSAYDLRSKGAGMKTGPNPEFSSFLRIDDIVSSSCGQPLKKALL